MSVSVSCNMTNCGGRCGICAPPEPPSEGFSRAVTGFHESPIPDAVKRNIYIARQDAQHDALSDTAVWLYEENERRAVRIQQLEAERDELRDCLRTVHDHLFAGDEAMQQYVVEELDPIGPFVLASKGHGDAA